MIPSKDFIYCPICRYEICLTNCEKREVIAETYIPKITGIGISNNIQDYKKHSFKLIKYLCPNDKNIIKEEIK